MKAKRLLMVAVCAGGIMACLLAGTPARAEDRPETIFFRQRVAPILSRCIRCHGEEKASHALKLTTRELALKGGESGPALALGLVVVATAHTPQAARGEGSGVGPESARYVRPGPP